MFMIIFGQWYFLCSDCLRWWFRWLCNERPSNFERQRETELWMRLESALQECGVFWVKSFHCTKVSIDLDCAFDFVELDFRFNRAFNQIQWHFVQENKNLVDWKIDWCSIISNRDKAANQMRSSIWGDRFRRMCYYWSYVRFYSKRLPVTISLIN